jgi:hypothetical protein
MSKFRYSMNGHWWKGNTHIHSTASDGGKTFPELAALFAAQGYHFLFRTDHWVASAVGADPASYPLLWLDGIELDGNDSSGANYHVVGLGSFQGLKREMGLNQAMSSIRAQGGLLILAHPHWTGNTFEDALRWSFDGVEIYNHICRWLNGKGDAGPYWSAMLAQAPGTLVFASDDAHLSQGEPIWNGGWIVVNAAECTPQTILPALRAGNYYASCGPAFEAITYDGEKVTMQCSPVRYARLVGPRWSGVRANAFEGELLTSASLTVPQDWPYAYLEIEDEHGRRAWTNTLFVD